MRNLASLTALLFCLVQPAHAGLLAFFNFDGNANDVTGNGYDGTVTGATLTAGYEGQAYDFGNTSDNHHIAVGLDINPGTRANLTMGAWVRTDSLGLSAVISHDDAGFDRSLYLDNRGAGSDFRWSAFGGSVLSGGPDPALTGTWVFLAARYGGGQFSLTVDGLTVTATGSPGNGHTSLWIGDNPSFSSEDFDGLIDNVFFYDEWLSDARLAEIRAGGANAILPTASSVPEPATLALLGLGLLGLWSLQRRRT